MRGIYIALRIHWKKLYGKRDMVLIIAEAGVNHDGNPATARELADAARDAGADIVKFQTFRAENVIAAGTPKAAYQQQTTGSSEDQLAMVRRLELPFEEHRKLRDYCATIGIEYLSTPFDAESADFLLDELKLERIKIPSGEITNAPLLFHVAKRKVEMIVSTGMATLGEIEEALSVIACAFLGLEPGRENFTKALWSDKAWKLLEKKVILLHCVTEYPAPEEEVHLPLIGLLRECFKLPVGYSDHTLGTAVSMAAVALGANTIEKHFTLDRTRSGPDHRASLEPAELKLLVDGIRQVEKAMEQGRKLPSAAERNNRPIARKILVAARDIRPGEVFTSENITTKRAGEGLPPIHYWDILGKKAPKAYLKDERILQNAR